MYMVQNGFFAFFMLSSNVTLEHVYFAHFAVNGFKVLLDLHFIKYFGVSSY